MCGVVRYFFFGESRVAVFRDENSMDTSRRDTNTDDGNIRRARCALYSAWIPSNEKAETGIYTLATLVTDYVDRGSTQWPRSFELEFPPVPSFPALPCVTLTTFRFFVELGENKNERRKICSRDVSRAGIKKKKNKI